MSTEQPESNICTASPSNPARPNSLNSDLQINENPTAAHNNLNQNLNSTSLQHPLPQIPPLQLLHFATGGNTPTQISKWNQIHQSIFTPGSYSSRNLFLALITQTHRDLVLQQTPRFNEPPHNLIRTGVSAHHKTLGSFASCTSSPSPRRNRPKFPPFLHCQVSIFGRGQARCRCQCFVD